MSHAKLTTLMVLMVALIAGTAFAGDYTVYGKLHLSTDFMNDTEDSQIRLSNNTSRFGMKGASEMNEDFTLVWQFENAINLAQKDFTFTGIANRNSYIGFKHEIGTLLFGIHDTPFKTLGRKSTFFFDSLGDHRTVTMSMDQRLQEIVMFKSKNYDGLQFNAMFQYDSNDLGALEAANIIDLSAYYTADEFFIGAAMDMATMGNYGQAYDTTGDGEMDTWGFYDADADVYMESESQMAFRGGFGYNAEEFALRALFQTISNKGGMKDYSAMTFGGEAKYAMNADYALKGAFYMADPNTDLDDDEYNLLAFGLDRMFGKSQWIYVQYAMVMNGDAQNAKLGGGWHGNDITAVEAGESPFGISVGVAKKW